MIIKDFTNMDRVGSSLKTLTRLLVNGKLVGSLGQRKIKKLPGYQDFITSLAISGGGTLTPHENAVFFKDPNHGYATSQTLFMIDDNTLYYYDSVNGFVAVSWDGSGSADFTPVADVRFWFERGTLHIAAGLNGTASVYQYIDREKTTDLNGYFNNNEEKEGFWFGEEELPTFDATKFTITNKNAINDSESYEHCLQKLKKHYLMGIYNCDGQEAIPSSTNMTVFKETTVGWYSFVAEIKITQTFSSLDKRVTAIDLYGGIESDLSNNLIDLRNDDDFPLVDWKFLRRIHINNPHILWSGIAITLVGDNTNLLIYSWKNGAQDELIGTLGYFCNDSLNNFEVRYRASHSDSWIYRNVTDTAFTTAGLGDHGTITVDGANIAVGTYDIQIISRWTASGDDYIIYTLWRFSGDSDVVDELGDPIESIQAYSLVEEYYPQSQFVAVQDRRTYRLGVTTDEDHKNMILWSETDTPDVVPNGNLVLLNTSNDEEPKGLEWVNGGLLALFEKSVHFIRMTGEPVTYDSEEGKFEDDCIASRSVVNANGLAFWFGLYGIKMYVNGEVKDITHDFLKDDYETLIASEYAGNSSSYEGIVGTYNPKERLVIWSLPNSTASISSVTVDCIAYDLETGGFIFLDSGKNYIGLVTNYDGITYGIAIDGIYELFGGSPDENTQMIWESGIFMADDLDDLAIERLRLRYNGAFTVKMYTDGTHAIANLLLPTLTSMANRDMRIMGKGEDYYIRLESTSDAGVDDEVEMIDVKPLRLPK